MWRLKLFLKILAGQLPALKRFFQALGYYQLGPMNEPEYALETFQFHFGDILPPRAGGGICLEIGPGLALSTAVVSKAAGFEQTLLLDCAHHALENLEVYRDLFAHFQTAGVPLPLIQPEDSLEDILRRYQATYWTDGEQRLKELPDQSIRFSFSQAVLSQIPRSRVGPFLRELLRVSQPGTHSSHWIDLTDYFGGGLHQLRFTDRFWESRWVRESGIYTNRLRYSQWLEHFRQAGIHYRISHQTRIEGLPFCRNRLDGQFQNLSEEDLLTSGFRVHFLWS